MFGSFRIAKARKACVKTLQPFVALSPGISLGEPWPPQFWRDPFVIGFMVKAIAIVSRGVKLTTDQRGHVLIGTLKDLGGYQFGFGEEVIALVQAGDAAFMLGGRNAETALSYLMELPMTDTEAETVERAKALAADHATLMGEVPPLRRDQIAGALMLMLFTSVVEKRLTVDRRPLMGNFTGEGFNEIARRADAAKAGKKADRE